MNPNSPNVVTQPHLGRIQNSYKPGDNMGGYLCLGKILKVHHKHNTADVQIVKTNNVIGSTSENEGKFGARLCVSTAHFNSTTLTSSGVVEPIQEGQLVILAFMDNVKNQPIILSSFHDTWSYKNNVLIDRYPLDYKGSYDDYADAFKYLRVFPCQGYFRVDGYGGVELSHPSKTFLKMDTGRGTVYCDLDDSHLGYDHQDLSEKDPNRNFTTLQGHSEEELLPIRILWNYRTSSDDTQTTWTKFFINSDGSVRWTRDPNDGTLTYTTLDFEGNYKIRRQLNSNLHEQSTDFSSVELKKNGSILLTRSTKDGISSISIENNGDIKLQHKTGSFISIHADGVTISSYKDLNLQANGKINYDTKE